MAKRKIDAKEAIDCIRAGMDDQAIMARFDLSAKGLQSLLKKLVDAGVIKQEELDQRWPSAMAEAYVSDDRHASSARDADSGAPPPRRHGKPPIDAKQVVRDIRAGMDDGNLMEKYRLSSKGLQNLFEQLVNVGAIRQSELDRRLQSFDSTVDLMQVIKQLGLDQRSLMPDSGASSVLRCPACGAVQTIQFEECMECGVNIEQYKKKQAEALQAKNAPKKCPACGRPWKQDFDECPMCGVIVSKFRNE